jgi:outer membrane PBP1 activator LpoA protein
MADPYRHRQARRTFLSLATGVGLSLLLAGCASEPRRQPPPRPIQPTRPEPSPNLPSDEPRNRVAVLVPMTGPNAGVGQSIANAANLALLDTGGERIRITIYDTAASGALAATKTALAEGNGLILGPLLAEDVRAAAPAARNAGVPMIAFSNDISVAGDGVYLMGFMPEQSIARAVGYARDRGVQRFGALVPQGVYGRRSSQAMIQAVERSGGRMIGMQEYDRSPGGMRAALGKLNAQGNYDAVLIADSGGTAARVATLIRASRNPRIIGTELWASEAELPKLTSLRGAWFASVPESMFGQLSARYRTRYGRTPYRLASLGYDAVLLTVRIGGQWPLGRQFPERELLDAGGFSGVDGAFRFTRAGIAERMLQVEQVDPAKTTIVSPAPKAF